VQVRENKQTGALGQPQPREKPGGQAGRDQAKGPFLFARPEVLF
jgi:hypothetical protein